MFASIFQGAQVLAGWAFGWLVPARLHSATDLSGTSSEIMPSSAVTPLQGQATAIDSESGGAGAPASPTPRGSFGQIDRAAVREATELWQTLAPAPDEQNGDATEILASLAEIDQPNGQDPQLSLHLALGDGDGLDPAGLSALAKGLGTASTFSPIIQPQIDIFMNDALTGALITIEGTANAALDDVYWHIQAEVPDAGGDITDLSLKLAIWNTDLL